MPYACWFLWQADYIEDFKCCLHFQFGVSLRFEGFFFWEVYFEGPNCIWRALKTWILNIGVVALDVVCLPSCCYWLRCGQVHRALGLKVNFHAFVSALKCFPSWWTQLSMTSTSSEGAFHARWWPTGFWAQAWLRIPGSHVSWRWTCWELFKKNKLIWSEMTNNAGFTFSVGDTVLWFQISIEQDN